MRRSDESPPASQGMGGRQRDRGRRVLRPAPGPSQAVCGSRNRILGRVMKPRANSSLRFMPPEYVFTTRSMDSCSSTRSINVRMRFSRSAESMWYRRPCKSGTCLPVRSRSRTISWKVTPMESLTSRPCVRTSYPATRATPDVKGRIPPNGPYHRRLRHLVSQRRARRA